MLVCALAGVLLLPQSSQARTADADRDGLANRFEKRHSHTNPRKADTDGDKLGDRYELRRAHTNPRKRDTDRDRLSDGFEVNGSKTSPRRKDTDGDGLSDGYEVKQSDTSPRRADDDGDGIRDGVEVLFGLDPNSGPGDGEGEPDPDPGPPDDPAPPDDPPPPDDPDDPEDPDNLAPNTSLGGGPTGTVASGSATFSFASSEPGSGFQCRLDGGAWSSCTSPKTVSSLAEGSHTFYVRAVDTAGNADPSPAQRTWTIDFPPLPDIIPPNTSLGSGGPHGIVTTGSASFSFTSSEVGSTFQCRLDSGAYAACPSPKAYSGLGEGVHNFYVRARDAAGNLDLTPAHRTWTVDFPAPPPPPPPPPGPADVFVSASGSDSNPCTSGAPCRSLARGYAVAAAGDVVGVAAGSYPSQTIPGGSKAVVFKGTGLPKLRQLDSGASNVTFDGFDVDGAFTTALTFHNSGNNSTFKNGRIGNVIDEKGALVSGNNFTFDNVLFHDVEIHTRGVHLECLYAIVVPGLTIKNSESRNCGVFDVFFTYGFWWLPLPPAYGGVTMENNHFGRSYNLGAPGYYTVMAAYTGNGPVFSQCGNSSEPQGYLTNWRVTGNTFELPTAYLDDCPARHQNFVWSGNTGG